MAIRRRRPRCHGTCGGGVVRRPVAVFELVTSPSSSSSAITVRRGTDPPTKSSYIVLDIDIAIPTIIEIDNGAPRGIQFQQQ